MQQCLCAAVIFVQYDVSVISNIVFSFLGCFSAGTSYKWRHNAKCRKKEPENTRCFWELGADYEQENVCQSWQQSGACNASSKVNGALNILRTQNKWSGETHLTSCHVLLISIMSSLHPVCSSTSPRLSHGEYRKAWRETADLRRAKCRPLDRVHPWRRPIMSHAFGGVRSVHLSDVTGIGQRFCNVRISPSQTCATWNPTGMPISRLPSASLQSSSACIHVRLNLEADVGADIMTYWAVIDDTLPLTSCTGRNIQCVWGGWYVCRSLQCGHLQDEGKWGAGYF